MADENDKPVENTEETPAENTDQKPVEAQAETTDMAEAVAENEVEATKEAEESLEEEKPVKKAKKENPNLKWYVVNTHSGHEKKVAKLIEQRVDASNLEKKVTEVLVPTRNVMTVKEGQQKVKEEQIFPGYVMVKMEMDEQTWYIIRNTEGVTGFVGTEGKPKPISEAEVESIKKFMSIETPEVKVNLRVGDAVKVKGGAFEGQLGTVNGINEQKAQVTVLLSFFGRETPVDLDFSDVIKL